MKIRTQLTLTSAIMGSTFLVTMWVVYHEAQTIEYYRRYAQALESEVIVTSNLHTSIRNQIAETMQLFFQGGRANDRLPQIKESVHAHLTTLEELDSESLTGHARQIKSQYEILDKDLDTGIALLKKGQAKLGMNRIDLAVNGIFQETLVPILQSRLKAQQDSYREMGIKLGQSISIMKVTVILIFGISTLLVSVLIHHLGQSFGDRLLSVLEATQKVKKGDLKNQIAISGKDELSELATAFNEMVQSLSEAKQTMLSQQEQITMHAKMSALGLMAAGIAHEINNPLAVIVADASKTQLLSTRKKLTDEDLAKSMEKILSTTERIAKIIRGLRLFARDGHKDPFKNASAHQVVWDTLDFCYARFKSNQVELRVGEISTTAYFECRAVQVSQVLLNLLNNAFDAVQAGPNPWVSVEAFESETHVEFVITDSGLGIPKEIADHILEPFFSTKGVGLGSGMGLSISAGIVKSHRGELELDRSSKHTRFTVRFPKRQDSTDLKAA